MTKAESRMAEKARQLILKIFVGKGGRKGSGGDCSRLMSHLALLLVARVVN